MNDCLAKDGESLTKKQKVKFEGESDSERGSDGEGSKGWLLGDYKVGDINFAIASVTKERQVIQQLKFLESEDEAMLEMVWEVGEQENKVMITLNNETKEATISADRKTITGGPGMLLHSELTWVPPDEAEQIRNRPKEAVTCPSVPHPLQPGKPGKLLFLSGPPGTGKSTMASLISERENRVFYEGDGFFLGFNPYISPGEDQVKCRSEKPALIGPGMKERLKGMFDYFGFTMTVARERTVRNRRGKASKPIDHSGKDRFLQLMAEDIARERMRVGGDWVVAFAVYDREDRDIFRKVLGNEVIFVLLDLDKDLMKKRLSRRKGGRTEVCSPSQQI